MNIQQAMEQIRGAVKAYLSKDENGLYRIPHHMQRPIIMLGPPGVGKTAIVAQVADELGINYVSYSITPHTRQTALGLPYIVEREYGGRIPRHPSDHDRRGERELYAYRRFRRQT